MDALAFQTAMETTSRGGPSVVMSARDIDERRYLKHLPIALALLDGPVALADDIVALAMKQVDLWERGSLCSHDYIAEWRHLLSHRPQAAAVLLERSAHAVALRQNSPFVSAIRKLQSLAHAA
ncbi:hypothetical protein CSQ96_05765 [Janthinobacterium sp. BJB412]|nr:hypothetical protein CSQ96_05765 [Janthinobacterium sp. BJB412]